MNGNCAQKHPGKVFLSVDDIADCLGDYQVFDTRYSLSSKDYGGGEYMRAHLPSASLVDMDAELSGPVTNTTARHPLPDAEAFIAWCKSRGIGSGRPALCYDDQCGAMGACRMWWMLHALGVEAYVLDGGFQAYEAAGLPLETGMPEERWARVRHWPYATAFRRALTIDEVPPNAVMVDARAAARFASTVRPYGADTLPGHIEGAVCLPWDAGVACDGHLRLLRPLEECRRAVLGALRNATGDGRPDLSDCVFYCGSGVTATFNIALVCHLGLGDPYLYCGSWSEYAGRFEFSVARRVVEEHGVFLRMMSPNRGDQPKATTSDAVAIVVDGKVTDKPDAGVMAAVAHMHVGEKARVFFKGGRIAIVEVLLRQ